MKKLSITCDVCEKESEFYHTAKLETAHMTWHFEICSDCLHKGTPTFRRFWAKIVKQKMKLKEKK